MDHKHKWKNIVSKIPWLNWCTECGTLRRTYTNDDGEFEYIYMFPKGFMAIKDVFGLTR